MTLKKINAALLKELGGVELVKGKDYFYFAGTAVERCVETGVYVSSLKQLTLKEWLQKARDLVKESSERL